MPNDSHIADPKRLMEQLPSFWVVEAIPRWSDGWKIIGVFTKREDAAAMEAEAAEHPDYVCGSAVVDSLPMVELVPRIESQWRVHIQLLEAHAGQRDRKEALLARPLLNSATAGETGG